MMVDIMLYHFNAWCPVKGHTHLKKQGLYMYVWPFSGHQAWKGYTFLTSNQAYIFGIWSALLANT